MLMFKTMKNVTILAAAMALVAATASAQYKTPPPAPPSNPGGVGVTPNNNIQVLQSNAPDDDLATAKRINRDEAIKMVKEGKAVWIDVRSESQYDEGHIPGALNFPLGELMSKLTQLPPGKYLITYCA